MRNRERPVPAGSHRAHVRAPHGPLRVALTIDAFRPVLGGTQTQTERLAPLLAARGVQPTVVTRRTGHDHARRERRDHLEIVRLPVARSGSGRSRTFGAQAVAWLVADRPHVVHGYGLSSAASASARAARILRRPHVLTPLTSGPHGDLAQLLAEPQGESRLRGLLDDAAALVCVSRTMEQELVAAGADRRRVVRIPHGVDIGHFRPPADDGPSLGERRRRLGLPPEGPLTITAGRLEPGKRIDRVIAAYAAAPGTLLIVGDGPERERLEAMAGAPGVADRVVFRPPVDDVAPLLRCADLYVTCSVQDGLSSAVLEAMACGLPVVAARAGSATELVDPTTGLLVDPARPAEVGQAIAGLLTRADQRIAFGRAGRQRVIADYTLTRTADRRTDLYRRLWAGRPS